MHSQACFSLLWRNTDAAALPDAACDAYIVYEDVVWTVGLTQCMPYTLDQAEQQHRQRSTEVRTRGAHFPKADT